MLNAILRLEEMSDYHEYTTQTSREVRSDAEQSD